MSRGSLPYDPDARRDTPLALKLKARILAQGPLGVADYIDACLNDPEHGYYRTHAAIGRDGDFITAPEISQVFGELVGLWCVVVWEAMGRPTPLRLVELGPGRGTLLRDALRAARVRPQFGAAIAVHLVELDGKLRDAQSRPPIHHRVDWHTALADIPPGPSIIVANEFLDTLPVDQHVHTTATGDPAHTPVHVGLDDRQRLTFGLPGPAGAPLTPLPPNAAIRETQHLSALGPLRARATTAPTAALLIDYGTTDVRPFGDTLQAVRAHRYEHPLTSPGEADLSVMVDFNAVAATLDGPLTIDGPVPQADFLGALGILERTSRLMAANPARANALETAVARLLAPNGMGTRFKVLGARTHGLPMLPGFTGRAEARPA